MKILAIRGNNLTSIAGEFSIELDQAPLNQSGLFAITGPTGAGKSTLLDALCVSLYNKIPRLENVGSPIQIGNDEKNALAHNDTRNLLRRGAASGYAETLFRGIDGKMYLARWEVERVSRGKNKGALKPNETSLRDVASDRLLGRTKNEVLQGVVEKIGLTFDQFRRSVLLAQGDFAAFLKAGTKDRGDLLERMTGTEIYSKIGTLAFERAKQEETVQKQLEAQLGENSILSDEARRQQSDRLTELGEQRTKMRERHDLARQQHDWLVQQGRLLTQVTEAEAQHQQTQFALAEFAETQLLLQQIKRCEPLRPVQQEAQRLETDRQSLDQRRLAVANEEAALKETIQSQRQQLEKLQKEHQAQRDLEKEMRPRLEEARRCDQTVLQQQQTLEQATQNHQTLQTKAAEMEQLWSEQARQQQNHQEQIQAHRDWLDTHRHSQAMCDQWLTWREDLERLVAKQQQQVTLRQSLDQQRNTCEQHNEQVRAAEHTRNQAQIYLQQCLDHDAQLNAGLDADALQSLQQNREQAGLVSVWLRETTAVLERRRQSERRLNEKDEKYQSLVTAGTKAASDEKAASEALIRRRERRDEAQSTLARLTLALSTNLSELRGQLVPGRPCPLCGAEAHPYREHAPANNMITDQKERVAELEAQYDQAVGQQRAANERLNNLRDQTKDVLRERKELTKDRDLDLTKLEALWANKPAGLAPVINTDDSESLAEFLREQESLWTKRADNLKQKIAENLAQQRLVAQSRQQLEQAQADFQKHDQIHRERQENRRQLEQQRSQDEQSLATLFQQIEEGRQRLTGILHWCDGWSDLLQEDPPALLERCEQHVEAWRHHENQIKALTKTGEALEQQHRQLTQDLAVARERLGAAQSQCAELATALATTQATRAKMLDGEPVDQVASRLESALQTSESAAQNAQAKLSQSERDHASLFQKAASLQEQLDHNQSQQQKNQQLWRKALAELGLEATEAGALLAHDLEWRQTQTEKNDTLEQQNRQGEALVKARRDALNLHQQHQPTTDEAAQNLEALTAQLEHLGAEQRALEVEFYAVKSRLDQDMETQAKRQGFVEQINKQTRVVELWQDIRSLIGSKDGNRFRQYAQSLTLDSLLGYANVHLDDLARRYRLARVPNVETLELQIIDRDMADEVRSVNSLSGGETFLVSLGLALGLASMSAERSLVESLFIDEGFGALDPESLDLALSALDSLQAMGRQVGVISHIPTLIERIGTRVCVVPCGGGRSQVRVEDAFGNA